MDEFDCFMEDLETVFSSEELEEINIVLDSVTSDHKLPECKLKLVYDLNVVKNHALSHALYLAFYDEKNEDRSASMEIESSIDVGTELRSYTVGVAYNPHYIEKRVFSHVELSPEHRDNRLMVEKFKAVKDRIEEIVMKQNYDNFVTGGGTTKTDEFYKGELSPFKDKFVVVMKTVKIDI